MRAVLMFPALALCFCTALFGYVLVTISRNLREMSRRTDSANTHRLQWMLFRALLAQVGQVVREGSFLFFGINSAT